MKKHGFTLLEVLIILVIIGIVTAVIFPAFKDVGRAANEKARKSSYYKEYNGGHSWVIRRPYGEDSSSMAHDPDCDCLKKFSVERWLYEKE